MVELLSSLDEDEVRLTHRPGRLVVRDNLLVHSLVHALHLKDRLRV